MTSMLAPSYPSRRGFSLVEVAIAVVIVSLVVITTVGLLAPVQQNIENVVSADEVSRLRRAVEIEMNIVRPGETYASGFDKAYDTVKKDSVVYTFFYRAEVPISLTDGRAMPASDNATDQRLGENYAQQAAVFIESQLAQAQTDGFIDAAEGRVFVVRFQLLESVMPKDKNGVPEAVNSFKAGGPEQFTEAVLPVSAEFYALDSIDLVAGGGASTALDDFIKLIKDGDARPVFELNMAFNR